MLVRAIEAAAFGTNCWVLAVGPGEECLVVDPGFGVLEGRCRSCCGSTGSALRRSC